MGWSNANQKLFKQSPIFLFSKRFLRVQFRICVFIQLQDFFLNGRFKFRCALREVNVEIRDHLRNIISRSYIFTCQNYFWKIYFINWHSQLFHLRNRSAPAVNCWVLIHCLEVSCKEDQITSAQREWFIFIQLTDKQWIITQQFTHWSWSILILTHNKRRKHIRSLQILPTFRHCTEELPPIHRLRRIRLHVIVTSFKRKNDVTPSNAMINVIF